MKRYMFLFALIFSAVLSTLKVGGIIEMGWVQIFLPLITIVGAFAGLFIIGVILIIIGSSRKE